MKRILFITPSLATGGTNSSLDALYSQIKNNFHVVVFAISHQPHDHRYQFEEVLLPPDRNLSYIYSNFSSQHGINKLCAVWHKFLKKINENFGQDYGIQKCRRVVRKLEKDNDYDIIVGFQEGTATQFASFFFNANKVAWIHCDYNKYLSQGRAEEELYKNFKKIICVSAYTASVFAERYRSLANLVSTIYNLIDVERIAEMGSCSINDPDFVKNGFTILSVGRFSPVKRFREIPAVAYDLKNRGVNFSWYIIGPDEGGEERACYESNLKKFFVYDRVKWLGGKSNPYPYFRAADLYVCLSESEACPMVFKEARLFDLPIVTTNFPSSYEFVRENEGCITSFANLSDAISQKLEQIKAGYRLPLFSVDNKKTIEEIHKIFD